MQQAEPLFIVDIIGEVVAATSAALFPDIIPKAIDYQYGRSSQILKVLIALSNASSPATKEKKYPLFACFQDFPESVGGETFYYEKVRFPKMSICNFTDLNWTAEQKYTKNFKPILYPIYREFLKQLARHKNIVGVDFPHVKWDRHGTERAAGKDSPTTFSDYVDAIEIQNMEIIFKQVQFCHTI